MSIHLGRNRVGITKYENLNPELTEQESALEELESAVNGLQEAPKTDGEYFVKVIDYDGTILKEAKLDAGDTFELPTPPSHDGLVFQEWSCSQDIVDNKITIEDNNVMAGAVYTTASGLNEFDIELTKVTGLDVTLNMDGTKDWGDGTSDDLTTHTYGDYGKYTIKCSGNTMTTSSSAGLFGQTSSLYNYYCIGVRLASITTITESAFQYCYSLIIATISNNITTIGWLAFRYCGALKCVIISEKTISLATSLFTNCYSIESAVLPNGIAIFGDNLFNDCRSLINIAIPNSVTKMGLSVFQSCYSLTGIIVPKNVISIGQNAFYYCHALKSITLPESITNISDYTFSSCYSLTSVVIPDSVKSMGNYVFLYCYALENLKLPNNLSRLERQVLDNCFSIKRITIPSGVTKINNLAFRSCHSLTTYDFSTHTTVPTLNNTNAFMDINSIAKIIVPDNLYDEWIVATNWATYADYIYKASEVQ